MKRPPRRPDEAILSRPFLASVVGYAVLITLCTLAAFVWALGRNPLLAPTLAFMTLAVAQIFHLGNARAGDPVLRPDRVLANRYALGAVGVAVILQLSSMYIEPLARVLHVIPLRPYEWAVAASLGLLPAIIGQAIKASRHYRSGSY